MGHRLPGFLVGGVAAAALAVAVAGGAASAQTPTPSGTPPAASSAKQRAAIVAVQKERIAADVAAGRLTQQQADRLNQRIDQQGGGLGLFGPGFAGRPGARGGARAPSNAIPVDIPALAQFLGLQPQELTAGQRAGKSLAQIAQEKGKSRDDLKGYLSTQAHNWVSQQVQQGRFTQQQGDQHLADLDGRIDRFVDRAAPARRPTPTGTSA